MKSKFVKYGEPAPYDCYLLVKEQDVPGYIAFEVLDLLDIDVLLQKALESMKTTIQALCLILFVVLFHLVIVSSFGLGVWLGLGVAVVLIGLWLQKGASYASL